ncbi:hypothetical protein Tco_0155496 [Tanacetum coccineum]
MADKEKKSTMKGFETNDQADYYSGITSIMVNGKNAYELKGKFLDDLHKNAFSGTNGEDAVEHIEYFLKIVDPVDLPNVNQEKLSVVVFLISLVGDAWRWFDRIKGSITSWVDLTNNFFGKYYPPSRTGKINTPIIKWDPTNPEFENWLASKFVNFMTMDIFTKGALWDYWKLGSNEVELIDKKTFDLEETNQDDEQEIGEIFRIETNLIDYETPLCEKFKEFNYLLKIDPDVLTNDIVGFKTYDEYKDDWIYKWNKNVPWVHEKPWMENGVWKEPSTEWYDALKNSKLKEEALRNKAIIEGLINEDVESNDGWKSWDDFENTNGDRNEWRYKNEHKDDERYELCGNETHELPVSNIRRFEMIKYSFEQDKERMIDGNKNGVLKLKEGMDGNKNGVMKLNEKSNLKTS